jgi:Protein of unknown function (DUF1236)
MMKRTLIGVAAAAVLATSALAQTVVIEPQQRTVIRNYVVKERVRPIEMRERVVVGATIPAEIELTPVPETIYTEVPSLRPYRYFVWDNRFVLVEPSSRRVIQIVE